MSFADPTSTAALKMPDSLAGGEDEPDRVTAGFHLSLANFGYEHAEAGEKST